MPIPEMEPVENASAEALLSSLKTIDPAERRKHASVFNYWLSIRANRQFPPIRDLDPLEISDAGPWSILLEMIGGGEDAVIRHYGQAIRDGIEVEKISDAPSPSLLACIHAKLPLVAACREAFAFEESFETDDGPRRCWLTLLPFSENGTWIDYVYGYVSLEGDEAVAEEVEGEAAEAAEAEPEAVAVEEEPAEPEAPEAVVEDEPVVDEVEPFTVPLGPLDGEEEAPEARAPAELEPEPETEPEAVVEFEAEADPIEDYEPKPEADTPSRPSFSAKVMESLASVGGFYGKARQPEPDHHEEPEPIAELLAEADAVAAEADEVAAEQAKAAPEEEFAIPESAVEDPLHSQLSDVRALAEQAREAQVRSNIALYEGLGAAYDFALAAEAEPEEYLRLVEAQGLKIQLRSPMKPVVRLAFDGMCDEPTIAQLEAVLAWALKQDLPQGSLPDRIQAEGGIGAILGGQAA